ncbi:MAG TPA: LysM peptidoglycan-binding domain-containing protein [Myxococcaceae bacterium]|nr:LysM peptidoglycan-binding domain-containing protein [Myxococcaceae bacterium]
MRLSNDMIRPLASSLASNPQQASAPRQAMGFSGVDSFTPAASVASSPQPYTVQRGDTLWGISQRFGTTVQTLRDLNPAVRNTDLIYPGQVLNVPGAAPTPNPTPSPTTQDYTIQSGDTLSGIATRFGTTVPEIQRLNPWITNPDWIQAGWVIKVPGGTPNPGPGPTPGPGPVPPGPLTNEMNHQFSLPETWPSIKQYSNQYGLDPHVLAGMMYQESGFKNWQVHADGTGHGLLGLDDNGLLPDFEQWVRANKPGQESYSAGRGAGASSIPPDWQIEYSAQKLASMSRAYGGDFAAARAWYRGPGGMNDSMGYHYENLIRSHIANLFANGDPPDQIPSPGPVPGPTNGPITTVDQANKVFMSQWGPTPYTSGGAPYHYDDCGPTSAAMTAEAIGLWPQHGPESSLDTIDRMRDTILGYDSRDSQLMGMGQLQTGLNKIGAQTQNLYGDPVQSVDGAVGRGHPVILGGSGVWNAWGANESASGRYLNYRNPGGHFVTVMGKTDDGRYIVNDPLARNGAITVTGDQIRQFCNGGFGMLEAWNPNAAPPPPPPPPPPAPARASFQTVTGNYMSAHAGGLDATGTYVGSNEGFEMTDLNGGDLRSGDFINLKTNLGQYVVAEYGGGNEVNANRQVAAQWERLQIVEIGGDGIIQDGDRVAFQTYDGQHYLIAENGGGANVTATSNIPGYFESFIYRKA